MRFKKLRFSVGVALIIFIFIIGNIIVFGKLLDKNSVAQVNNQNMALIDPKKISPPEILMKTKSEQPKENIQNTTEILPVEQTKPPVVEPAPSPEPVVVHTTRRTRAS